MRTARGAGRKQKAALRKRALNLSYFTVAYNVVEGILSIFAGLLAGSVALVGFGLDSAVESLSGGIMIWRFGKHGKTTGKKEEEVEERATKLVGYTFIILAAYIIFESASKLYYNEKPDPSMLGIVIAAASIIVMPLLYLAKNRTGKALKSKSLIADSKETLACSFLSVALLGGLLMNYLFGFWQADPVVGIFIAIFLVNEGREVLEGEEDDD